MKKIVSCIIFALFVFTIPVKAQSEERPEVIRDRLMLDVFHAFWFGMPKEVKSNKFNPGFNVSVMWDFKNHPKKPISFGLGLGVTYYSQFTDAILQYDAAKNRMRYYVLPTDTMAKLNRTTYINCNLPLEFRYRNSNGFKFSIGVRVGITAEISHRYKGPNYNGSNTLLDYKDLDFHNKNKFNFDTYFRMGWKYVSFYYCYQVTPLFEKDKGPRIMPMSLGVTWNLF